MRITFITTLQEYWGGSEVLWVKAAEHAIAKGHQVQVVVYNQKNGLHPALQQLKKHASFVEMRNNMIPANYGKRAFQSIKEKVFPYALTGVTVFKPDCIIVSQVHSYSAAFHPVINALLQQFKKPYFLISQFNADQHVLKYEDIIKARKNLSKAKWISFVSGRNKATVEKQLAMKLLNADVIGNHPNADGLKYVPYPDEKNSIHFASVARLEANFKGQDILMEILSGEKWKDRPWHLNFYGSGPDEQYLKDLTVFYNLEKRISFHGHVQDIKQVWATNHALLFPSIAEGKPLAIQEAMLCGRICIASDVGGNAEAIDDGINGYVASSFFTEPFGETLDRAWKEADNWEAMGKKGHDKMIKHLDFTPHQTLLDLITNT